ncbi:MAG: Fic family protein [Sedimentisphaerales bacterium]|nr:Fic family protein [Sedimentisphaerales bacterium]MBN2843929.1 Fic family protein [Sedimentisphaerales bacterium]
MQKVESKSDKYNLAGYAWLVRHFDLQVLPHWHKSETGGTVHQRSIEPGGSIKERYPRSYQPGVHRLDHFEFALKYEGLNLEILAGVFARVEDEELSAWITAKPQGQYTRRIWYLYEWLTGRRLPIADLSTGNYVDVLDKDQYFTTDGLIVRRQRVRDNMPGTPAFCPLIRKTKAIAGYTSYDLAGKCHNILAQYPEKLLNRAISYMYTKETKSSFAIEHIVPNASRAERFAAMLHSAESQDYISKALLVGLQNRIVDPRYAESDYRTDQNYVGETVAWQQEKIHYIPPEPQDLPDLMQGLISAHIRMNKTPEFHPVIHAAAIAFGFVFMHPFGDGNGRLHRFLIHNILARRQFVPSGLIFPISAAMLNNLGTYDACLESFSKPLMTLINYTLNEEGKLTVITPTANYYRFIDMTAIAETLFQFIQITIEKEMVSELNFLRNYDRTKTAIQAIVDMPDQKIDLFIRLCLQNNGLLSQSKHKSHFAELTSVEVELMQKEVLGAYK